MPSRRGARRRAVREHLVQPPIRVGKAVLHDLLRTWLPRLEPDGTAYLVVQKNLGSDSLQRWIAAELGMPCERYATSRGFRVLAVTH